MKTTVWCLLLSLLIATMPAWSSDPPGNHRTFVDFGNVSGGTPEEPLPAPPVCSESIEFSENPDEFRWQLVDLFHEIEFDLALLLGHPGLQSLAGECVPAEQFAFADLLEQALIEAPIEELEYLRSTLGRVPGLASVPARLEFAIQQLPPEGATTNTAGPCSGASLELILGLKLGGKALATAASILHTVYDSIDDDSTLWKSWVIAAAIVAGAADVATILLEGAVDVAEYSYDKKQECLEQLCVLDTFNVGRRGRGCDGIDQNCLSGPDDCLEDRRPPVVALRRNVELQCYPTLALAEAAVFRHTLATDDCQEAEVDWPSGVIPENSCDAVIQITATDRCDNVSSPVETILTIDDEPPLIECQVELASMWPVNNALADVGLSYTVSDGCDGSPKVELIVTSDEPTATSYGAGEGIAEAPDARVLRLADGQFQLLLRAQRSSAPHGDGRVYRARVQATDRCGNTSHADCLVSVSLTTPPSAAVNSGQRFDATAVN